MRYDTIVIGAGLAGLTTACWLAQANQKVLLMANGLGALLLASGCIDVLGFHPASAREPVQNPLDKLDDFLVDYPNHPYRFTGKKNIETGLEAFQRLVNNHTLDYRGTVQRNWLLPSAAGAVRPTCLAPASLANGELDQGGKLLIVGFRELRDFYPALISQNLNEQDLGVQAAPLTIDAPTPLAGRMDITPIELAHAFEKADFRRQVVNAIKTAGKGCNRVGFPAVLGINQHAAVMADLEQQLDKTVFEISTLPPSVPGRRLFDRLRQIFLQVGGRMMIGSKVVGGVIVADKVREIRFETSNRLKTTTAPNYVLATGGIFGGGIQTDSSGGQGRIWEPIFGLPIVAASSNRHHWFAQGFLTPEGQPVAHYGVQVNQQLNPVNGSQTPLATNLYIAGATIAGSDWTHGRTGEGVALATAAAVVEQISQTSSGLLVNSGKVGKK